jgi:non-heme chloroperoxidase
MSRRRAVAMAILLAGSCLCSLVAPKEGSAESQYAKVSDELQIYYEDAGQGAPIILIPGWTASEQVFSNQMKPLSKTHRVIAFDPRSQGLSTKTLTGNNYTQHGRDLAGLIDKLALTHVTLVGWSAGCMDAYAYMRQRGMDNLAAFVCIDHPPRGLSAQPGEWAAGDATDNGLARVRSTMDMITSKPTALFETYAKALNARDLTPEETSWFVRQGALTPEYAVLLLRADIWFSDFRDEAKKIDGTVPVLNVISEPNVPKAIPWIKANTPHSETFTIKRHMSFWSEPDSFNSQLESFLTNIK